MADGLRPIPEIPPVLQDASRRGVLIPFVGAGVSVLAGCPTWRQLADGALLDCIRQGKFTYGQLAQIEHLGPRVRLSIARGLELEHGIKIDFGKLVQPAVSAEKKESGNRVYRSLGELGSTFVTTNYDGWLDTEIADQLTPIEAPAAPQTTTTNATSARRRIHEVNEFTPANLNQTKTVIHLHGSLAAPDGMIMTTREYITRYRNDRTDAERPALRLVRRRLRRAEHHRYDRRRVGAQGLTITAHPRESGDPVLCLLSGFPLARE